MMYRLSDKRIEVYFRHVEEGHVFKVHLEDNGRVNNDVERFAVYPHITVAYYRYAKNTYLKMLKLFVNKIIFYVYVYWKYQF